MSHTGIALGASILEVGLKCHLNELVPAAIQGVLEQVGVDHQRRKPRTAAQDRTLCHSTPLFVCVIAEGEFDKGKPEPEVYHHALNALGVATHEAWMVGDNLEWEVAAPKQRRIYVVWVDFAAKGLPANASAQPDRLIPNVSSMYEN